MPLRMIEVSLSGDHRDTLEALLVEHEMNGAWTSPLDDGGILVRVLVTAEKTEALLDDLENRFTGSEAFRVVVLPVEAILPRPEEDKAPAESAEATGDNKQDPTPSRISREELYTEIVDGLNLSPVYTALVVLSTIVAAVGLLRDSLAVIIGAMVIAPLLGPNVGLAFATTLGDIELGSKALKTNLAGITLALIISVGIGLAVGVPTGSGEILTRTTTQLSDILLALAAGCAGVLAFTSGISAALIGVMVAVALLPPLVTVGLLLGAGAWSPAAGAFLLLMTNLICVNLAGVLTFLFQGIRPRTWWETTRARRATRVAVTIWSALLVVLAVLIYLTR